MTLPTDPSNGKAQLSMSQIADEFGDTRDDDEIRLGDRCKDLKIEDFKYECSALN